MTTPIVSSHLHEHSLLTYSFDGEPRAGVVVGSSVYDLAQLTGVAEYRDLANVLRDWPSASTAIGNAAAAQDGGGGTSLSDTQVLAPLPDPGTIYCAGANYRDHLEEMARVTGTPIPTERGVRSWHFIKSGRAVIGPGATVHPPAGSKSVDWEVELAAVIGIRGKDIPRETALDHVAGYTIAIDFSARDLARRDDLPERSPFRMDWLSHKNFDGSCPLGPFLVPADQVEDPQDLDIELLVNGVQKQASNTKHMIYSLADQIHDLSSRITLWPGDIILTGTPAGVGSARGEFLSSGDVVTARVRGMGELVSVIA